MQSLEFPDLEIIEGGCGMDRCRFFFQRSKTFFAREAIEQHLEDLEDYYLGLEAMKNPGRLYTPDEAKRELGL